MKRGIVAYQNRKVLERDEVGGERAQAMQRLTEHQEFQKRIFGD